MVNIYNEKILPSKKIVDVLKPTLVYIPLISTLGYKYDMVVKVGDYICKGDIVGINKLSNFPIHASVSGFVIDVVKKYSLDGSLVDTVVIENDFKERYRNKRGKKKYINSYSKLEFINMLRDNGIVNLYGSDYPSFMNYYDKENIKYLIINGIDDDMFSSTNSMIMYNYTEELLAGIDAVLEIMNIETCYIAVNYCNELVINKLLKYKNTYPSIKIYGIMDGYPSGSELNILNSILDKNYDSIPDDLNVIFGNVSLMYAIYEMLLYNRPLTEIFITVSGSGCKDNANVRVKIGSEISYVMECLGGYKDKKLYMIANDVMRGNSLKNDDVIITKDLHTIVCLPVKVEETIPCIKCGKCSYVCPSGLMPIMIIKNKERAKKLRIDKCNNCGLCSYVCPSKIELSNIMKSIKEEK